MEKNKAKNRLKIKASIRDNRRYFIVNADNKSIEEAILEYIGILGFAKSAYMQVFVDGFKKTIGSCTAQSLNDVRASLAFKKMKIEKVSGTIKGLNL